MFLNDPLAVIGVFLLGASAGACLQYARYRGLLALCNRLLAESSPHTRDGMLMARHFGQPPMEGGSTLRITRVQLPVSPKTEFSNNEIVDFESEINDQQSLR
jgi:hypothetical protein